MTRDKDPDEAAVRRRETPIIGDQSKLRRKNRTARPAVPGSDPAGLRSRLAAQAAEIERLRGDLESLTEDLLARDGEAELMLMDLTAAGTGDEDARAARWRENLRLRRFVGEHVARGRGLVVVSEGDEALLRHTGCRARYLSSDRAGGYIGFHPSSGRVAVAQLEAARWCGADALLIPRQSLWWLEHFGDLTKHLQRRYTLIAFDDEVGALWDLRRPSPVRDTDDLLNGVRFALGREPVILDWHTGADFTALFNECQIVSPPGDGPKLPYLGGTIDVVAVAGSDKARISEARRVAGALVVGVTGSMRAPVVDVLWRAGPADDGLARVSIVVAAREGRPSTQRFLGNLLDTLPASFTGEVVVDHTIDGTLTDIDGRAGRIKRLAAGDVGPGAPFTTRVRRAAEAASGDVLVVLDASTWPVAGWLPPLVHLLRQVPEAGVVTGMLLDPDGRLVGAGRSGDADRDGNPRGDDIEAGHHTHVQQVTQAPSALFATQRRLFLDWSRTELDDRDLATAFCAYVRSAGRTMLYQPETLAISSWRDG